MRLAADLRLHAHVGKLLAEGQPRLGVVQRILDVVERIAEARDDAHAGDDDSPLL